MATDIELTTCILDCPDSCSLAVTVEDGRVARVAASDLNPDTRGFICSKVNRMAERLYHPDRLLYPARRTGRKGAGEFERVSWETALAEIAERLTAVRRQHGGEAILPFHYGGSNGLLTDGLIDRRFFARLGASRLEKTICAAPTTAVATGMYGKIPGVAFEDFPEARLIIVWGANPRASNIHLAPWLKEAKRRGAFIAYVDPRRNVSASDCDLHLPVVPGGDLPLALGMIERWRAGGRLDEEFLAARAIGLEPLLEAASEWPPERAAAESGVPAEAIRELADRYADATPALIRCGWGLERNRNGGQAVAAVLAMPALLGKFGVRGGGYTMSNSGATSFDPAPVLGNGAGAWSTRGINMTRLGRVLNDGELDPPVQALFVYNANPMATVPDQQAVRRGLERDDLFTVVHEQVMTDTALYADYVLPAVTFLEGHDIKKSYGSYVIGGVRPVIEPCGEARTNMELFHGLEEAMGWEVPALDVEQLVRDAAGAVELVGGRRPDAARLLAGRIEHQDFPGRAPVQMVDVQPGTSDGLIHLTPRELGPRPYAFLPPGNGRPLALISPGSSRMITSTFGEFNLPTLELTIHPEDAGRRGLATGDVVRVWNELGEVECLARVSDAVRPGVVSMPKGAWAKSSLNGSTSTALCPDHVNVVADGACFNDARVEVERLRPT